MHPALYLIYSYFLNTMNPQFTRLWCKIQMKNNKIRVLNNVQSIHKIEQYWSTYQCTNTAYKLHTFTSTCSGFMLILCGYSVIQWLANRNFHYNFYIWMQTKKIFQLLVSMQIHICSIKMRRSFAIWVVFEHIPSSP